MTPPASRPPALDDLDTLRAFVPHLRDGLYVADADGRLLDVSPRFVSLVGATSADALLGRPLDELIAGAVARRVVAQSVVTRDGGDGRTYQCGILAEREEADDAAAASASHRDELTGVYDRGQLDLLGRELDRAPGGGWACLYVDVEGFDAHTAQHGRESGDGVLVRMARFLMRQVRADEPVVRLGAHEFVVVLHGTTGGRTEQIARRIQLTALLTAPAAFTLGWAMHERGERIEALVARAAGRRVLVRVTERQRDARGRSAEPAEL